MGLIRASLREVKALLRSKETIFWVIVWPILWILLVAFVFIPTPRPLFLDIAIIDLDKSSLTNISTTTFSNTSWSEAFEFKNFTYILVKSLENYAKNKNIELDLLLLRNASCSYPCRDLATKLIKEENYDIAIVIPDNASLAYSYWVPLNISIYVKAGQVSEEYLYLGSIIPVLTNISVNTSLERIEMSVKMFKVFSNITFKMFKGIEKYMMLGLYGIAFPIAPDIEVVKPKTIADRAGALGFTTIGGIGYIVLISSLTSSVGIFAYRKENGTLRRILSVPIRFRELVAMELFSSIIFQSISSLVVVVVGLAIGARIIFDMANINHWIAIAALLVAMIFSFFMGLLLAPLAKTARGASALAIPIGLILVFTTGIWWPPKEMLVAPLRMFADIFPPSLAFDIIRDLLVWNKPLSIVIPKFTTMLIGLVVVIIINVIIYKKKYEEIVHNILRG